MNCLNEWVTDGSHSNKWCFPIEKVNRSENESEYHNVNYSIYLIYYDLRHDSTRYNIHISPTDSRMGVL